MRVVVIHGQSHTGNTYKLTQRLVDKLDCKSDDIQQIFLKDMPHCVGCFSCILKDENICPHREITQPVIEKMQQADVIVLASPNYCYGMTSQMKALVDHLGYRWLIHRPYDMRKKQGVAISTAAGAGASNVVKEICRQFMWWGVGRSYKLDMAVWAENFESIPPKRLAKIDRRISKIAKKINERAQNCTMSLKNKMLFIIMKKLHFKGTWNKVDDDYWRTNFK